MNDRFAGDRFTGDRLGNVPKFLLLVVMLTYSISTLALYPSSQNPIYNSLYFYSFAFPFVWGVSQNDRPLGLPMLKPYFALVLLITWMGQLGVFIVNFEEVAFSVILKDGFPAENLDFVNYGQFLNIVGFAAGFAAILVVAYEWYYWPYMPVAKVVGSEDKIASVHSVLWLGCALLVLVEVFWDMLIWMSLASPLSLNTPIWQMADNPFLILMSGLALFLVMPPRAPKGWLCVWLVLGSVFATAYYVTEITAVEQNAVYLSADSYGMMFQNGMSNIMRDLFYYEFPEVVVPTFVSTAISRQTLNTAVVAMGWAVTGFVFTGYLGNVFKEKV